MTTDKPFAGGASGPPERHISKPVARRKPPAGIAIAIRPASAPEEHPEMAALLERRRKAALEAEPKPADQTGRGFFFNLEKHVRRHLAWARITGVGYEPTAKRKGKKS